MIAKSPPPEPINTITVDCDIWLFDIHRTILKISPHCWKRNEEFGQSKKKKIRENLENYFLSDKVIKDLVQQITEEGIWFEGVNSLWPAWKYYGHDELIDKRNGLNHLMIFFLDDDIPKTIGVITVYPYE